MSARLKNTLLTLLSLLVFNTIVAQTPSLVICVGGTINYREFNTGSSEPSVAWDWTFEGGTPATSTLREPSVKYNNAGLFKATCISTFQSGAKDTGDVYVLVITGDITSPGFRDTTICANSISLTLDAQNKDPYNKFLWTSPDVTLSPADTLQTLNITQAGTYKVKITNICKSYEEQITVTKGVVPSVDLGPDKFVCRNISLNISAGNNTTNTYLWSPYGETTSTITANFAGEYSVVVTSPDGCTATDKILLIDSCPPVVYLPTAFTPNDAPPNDLYQPYLEGFKSMNMKIYNRWGEKLFETDILNDGWDGTFNGEPCIEGTYVCLIELMGNDNFRKVLYREFHLLR